MASIEESLMKPSEITEEPLLKPSRITEEPPRTPPVKVALQITPEKMNPPTKSIYETPQSRKKWIAVLFLSYWG
ncbi:hypothetical protein V6N12_003308 [Hibiscus sabdariffa]|uniref:Uncharacterized protein n=1 Tax=Hibiscus sabdariffa TaxID=183260 RepID=A0ABR2EBL8_9ROSI